MRTFCNLGGWPLSTSNARTSDLRVATIGGPISHSRARLLVAIATRRLQPCLARRPDPFSMPCCQRPQVIELVEQLIPLRKKAEAAVAAAVAVPEKVFDVARAATASGVPTDPKAVEISASSVAAKDGAAMMHRVTSALVALKQLGVRSQQVAHSLEMLAGASSDQVAISSGEASERARRIASQHKQQIDSLCGTTSWCLLPARHDGPCTAVPAATEDEEDDESTAAVELAEQAKVETRATATSSTARKKASSIASPSRESVGMACTTPAHAVPVTPSVTTTTAGITPTAAEPESDALFGNVADPFATQAKVMRTPAARPAAATRRSSPVRRSPRAASSPVPTQAAVSTSSPLARSSKRAASSEPHLPVPAAVVDEATIAAPFVGRGLARTPVQGAERSSKRRAVASSDPTEANVSPIPPSDGLNTTFTKDTDSAFAGDANVGSTSTTRGVSATSTPPRSTAGKRVARTPIMQTPRSSTAPRSSSRLRNSVGRI